MKFVLVIILTLFVTPSAFATQDAPLVQTDKKISKKITDAAQSVDLALSGEEKAIRKNRTQLILKNQVGWAEGGVFTYRPAVDFRIDLPTLQEKLQIRFNTSDDTQERGVNQNRLKTTPPDQKPGAGASLGQSFGNIETNFEPRVDYRDKGELSYYLTLKTGPNGKSFRFRPTVQLALRSYAGASEFVSLNPEYTVYQTLVLGLINEEQYTDQDNILSTNHGIRLGFDYSDYTSQSLSLIYESSSRPNMHLDRYVVSAGVTHKIFKDVLHLLIVPYLAFPRTVDWRISPGINFELSLIF